MNSLSYSSQPPPPGPIRTLLVDDHQLVRLGLRKTLEMGARNLTVCGEATTGEEAVEAVRRLRPDIVLLDLNMPGMGGIEALRIMVRTRPAPRVMVLTSHSEPPYPAIVLREGAGAYLSKKAGIDEIVRAIHVVMQGGRYLSADLADAIVPSPFEELTTREFEVVALVLEGEAIAKVGERLHLSPKTVSTYYQRAKEKLGVQTDGELVRKAIDCGLLPAERLD